MRGAEAGYVCRLGDHVCGFDAANAAQIAGSAAPPEGRRPGVTDDGRRLLRGRHALLSAGAASWRGSRVN